MTDPSASRMMRTTDGQPDILTFQMSSPSLKITSGALEFNKIMASSGNKIRLQELVKEHMKTQVSRLSGGIIYCEGEMSTNLRTGAASVDFGFKHP